MKCEEGGSRFMVAWVEERGKGARKPEEQERGGRSGQVEVEVAPGMAIESLRLFEVALVQSTQEIPKRRRLR